AQVGGDGADVLVDHPVGAVEGALGGSERALAGGQCPVHGVEGGIGAREGVGDLRQRRLGGRGHVVEPVAGAGQVGADIGDHAVGGGGGVADVGDDRRQVGLRG